MNEPNTVRVNGELRVLGKNEAMKLMLEKSGLLGGASTERESAEVSSGCPVAHQTESRKLRPPSNLIVMEAQCAKAK